MKQLCDKTKSLTRGADLAARLRRWSVGLAFAVILAWGGSAAFAQKVAIKNNLAYDALMTPNISLEAKLATRWTMDLQLGANFFLWTREAGAPGYTSKKWGHWLAQPGVRYWTCEAFNGFFVGAHLHGGLANIGGLSIPFILQNKNNLMQDKRYEAYFYGGGLSAGYQWTISPRFSIDFEVGAGYARIHYDKYPCTACGSLEGKGVADYVGPTKAAVSLVFFLK